MLTFGGLAVAPAIQSAPVVDVLEMLLRGGTGLEAVQNQCAATHIRIVSWHLGGQQVYVMCLHLSAHLSRTLSTSAARYVLPSCEVNVQGALRLYAIRDQETKGFCQHE